MRSRHVVKTALTLEIAGSEIVREVQVRFTYLPGAPEQGPSYASGGQPADPDEVEIDAILVAGLDKLVELPEWMVADFEADAEFMNWLCGEAIEDLAARADEAAEMKADERRGN
jgi:hypothetical protein